MRAILCVCCWYLLSALADSPKQSVRRVDFKNFDFLWSAPKSWPDRVEWQRTSESEQIRMVDGRWALPDSDPPPSGNFKRPFAGLSFDEIAYGDVAGDSKEEAIVVLRYDSGGTQYHYWIYIYGMDPNRVTLLAYLRAGDRSYHGLYRVYLQNRILILEVYDPDYEESDCCSSGLLRSKYRWDGRGFIQVGRTEKDTPKVSSRRRVSLFGMPEDQMRR